MRVSVRVRFRGVKVITDLDIGGLIVQHVERKSDHSMFAINTNSLWTAFISLTSDKNALSFFYISKVEQICLNMTLKMPVLNLSRITRSL